MPAAYDGQGGTRYSRAAGLQPEPYGPEYWRATDQHDQRLGARQRASQPGDADGAVARPRLANASDRARPRRWNVGAGDTQKGRSGAVGTRRARRGAPTAIVRWMWCQTVHRWHDWERPTFLSDQMRWHWCLRCHDWR